MQFRQVWFVLFLALGCFPLEGAPPWACSSEVAAFPPSAKLVLEASDQLGAIQKIRSVAFAGYRLAGTPSPNEIPPTLLSCDPLYENKLAGRLAFFESLLADPRQRHRVTVIVDEATGHPAQVHPTHKFFLDVASHKPNYVASAQFEEQVGRQRSVRAFYSTVMAASGAVQAATMYASDSMLAEKLVAGGMHLVLWWLGDRWVRAVTDRTIYGADLRPRIERYGYVHRLDHQLIPYASRERWAYMSINMGEKKWDLFSHRGPSPDAKLSLVLLGFDPGADPVE